MPQMLLQRIRVMDLERGIRSLRKMLELQRPIPSFRQRRFLVRRGRQILPKKSSLHLQRMDIHRPRAIRPPR